MCNFRLLPLLFGLLVWSLLATAQQEGIEVHGHWKLTVFNPDGTKVSEVEFDNALESNQGTIPNLVTGEWTVGGIFVVLDGSPVRPCGGIYCSIAPAGLHIIGTPDSTDLVADLTGIYPGPRGLRLTGSVTVDANTTISRVETQVTRCSNAVSPKNCRIAPPDGTSGFTAHTLAPGTPVTAGQIVQVQVDFTFQ